MSTTFDGDPDYLRPAQIANEAERIRKIVIDLQSGMPDGDEDQQQWMDGVIRRIAKVRDWYGIRTIRYPIPDEQE